MWFQFSKNLCLLSTNCLLAKFFVNRMSVIFFRQIVYSTGCQRSIMAKRNCSFLRGIFRILNQRAQGVVSQIRLDPIFLKKSTIILLFLYILEYYSSLLNGHWTLAKSYKKHSKIQNAQQKLCIIKHGRTESKYTDLCSLIYNSSLLFPWRNSTLVCTDLHF